MGFEPLEIVVPEAAADTRLDRFLPEALSRRVGVEISRRRVRRWIEQGAVFVEGRRVRVASRALRAGWRVTLRGDPRVDDKPSTVWEMESSHLLFEDEHLLALDKPSGVASQALRADARDHLLAAATRYLRRRGGEGETRLWAVHRLDRGTSGVVLVARSAAVASALGEAFADQRVGKIYRAVVAIEGKDPIPETWRIEEPLAIETLDGGRRRATVSDDGKDAKTVFRTVARIDHRAWVEARPESGRMHQVRVHLAHGGWPIVGDRLYGRRSAPSRGRQRLMLHAHRLVLDHPITGRRLDLASPLPTGFEAPSTHG